MYAVVAALRGTGRGRREWVISARHAVYALAMLLTLAVIVLEAAYLRSDFSFGLVVDNSSTTTPTFYKMTAMWSSQAGSLLLWVWLLSIFSALALAANQEPPSRDRPVRNRRAWRASRPSSWRCWCSG